MTTEEPISVPEAVAEAPEAIVPKKRLKQPSRPDETEYKSQTEALQQSIVAHKKRAEKARDLMQAHREGQGKGSGEQGAVKSKLAELRAKFNALMAQRQEIRTQLDSVTKSRDGVRNSMKDLRGNLRFTSVEAIDAQVAALERRQAHESLSLAEEKRLMEDVRALNKSRTAVAELTAGMARLEADDSSRTTLQDSLKSLGEGMRALRAEEDEWKAKLAELQAAAAAEGASYPDWKNEVAQCREVCKQAYEKIVELRAENDARWEAYKVANAEWREADAADRKRRYEERQKEREERDAQYAARAAENQAEPFDREVTMADQLLKYLAKFAAPASAAAPLKAEVPKGPAGFKPFQKEVDETDAWLLGGGGKKGKGKKGAGAPGPTATRLTHSIDILEAFGTLSIPVPITAATVDETLERVKAQKAAYLAKREEVKSAPPPTPKASEEGAVQGEAAATPSTEPATKPAPKGKKAGAAANGKLADLADESFWPSMGSTPVPAPAAVAEAESESIAAPAGADEAAPSSTPDAPANATQEEVFPSPSGEVTVGLSLNEDVVSLAINHA